MTACRFAKVIAFASLFCLCSELRPVLGATYYAAANGNDANPGTLASPLATLNGGAALLKPGDTLYLRGGTFWQTLYVPNSGTPDSPLTIAGYPGEVAVIDGGDTNPVSSWGSLVLVEGSNVVVRGITVKRSNWVGVALKGQSDQAFSINSQSNMENGIIVAGQASQSLVQDCLVYYNARSNEQFRQLRGGWATGLSAARGANSVTLRHNRIWNNWGEGLSTYEAQSTVMEGNVVYDNQVNIYLSDTKFSVVRSNLIYCTAGNVCSNASQIGISLGDENYTPPSSDNSILNNLLLGNARNIDSWSGIAGGGLVNVLIAYNTCANSSSETNLKVLTGNHTNSVIKNNIFVQEDSLPVAAIQTTQGLIFSHNLWSKSAPSSAAGPGDVVGSPNLLKTGGPPPASFSANWFRIPATSPAVGAAEAMPEATVDFFGVPRGNQPDMGAIQHLLSPPTNLKILSSR